MRIFHFLSAQNALSDIVLRRIRISRYGDLNDPFELLAASLENRELRRVMHAWKDDFHNTLGLLCFSRAWENSVLWSHYAAKHRGIALGFDLADQFALEIRYSEERLPIQFKNGDPSQGLDQEFVQKLMLTKFVHWKYEEEVRMVMNLDDGTLEDGSYFYSISKDLELREVILGPLCSVPVETVQSLVDSIYQSVRVRKARLDFKWFKVVTDEQYENTSDNMDNSKPG